MSTTIKFPIYIVADTQSQLDNAVSFARQMLGFPRADLFTVRQLNKSEEVDYPADYQTLIQLKQVHGTKRAIISVGEELID